MTIFVGEPGAALGHPALSVPEENLRGLVELIFTDWMSFLPPNHRCQITTKKLTLTSSLTSSFLHLQPDLLS